MHVPPEQGPAAPIRVRVLEDLSPGESSGPGRHVTPQTAGCWASREGASYQGEGIASRRRTAKLAGGEDQWARGRGRRRPGMGALHACLWADRLKRRL